LHVEEAEDKLVQATETAIGLMKAVLENVSQASTYSLCQLRISATVPNVPPLGAFCECS
jgi:hypothetical protein